MGALLRTCLIYSLSLGIVLLGVPTRSWAESTAVGEGSIVMEFTDAAGNVIPEGLLHPGMEVTVRVKAFDANGVSIPCTADITPEQGFTGNQIQDIVKTGDSTATMTMGKGFGSAEVKAQCKELPNVRAKSVVANNTLKTPPKADAPKTDTPATPSAAAGAGSEGAMLGVLAGVGVAALTVSLLAAKKTCTPPQRWCKTSDTCCPSADMYYCSTPSNLKGCYADVFITGCGAKEFCTTEY